MSKRQNINLPETERTGWPWNEETIPVDLKDLPKISIVTPSYNQGDFLEETLRSIILQNYPNLELIVIDGGSKDNSIEVIERYSEWISYWESAPDKGQSHALNKGFAIATGVIGNWINSDDLLLPGTLYKVAEMFAKTNTKNFILAGPGIVINERSVQVQHYPLYKLEKGFPLNISFPLSGGNQQSFFYSMNLFRESGGINPTIKYPMDIDLYIKMGYLNPEIITTDKDLGAFRVHLDSKTKSQSLKMADEKKYLLDYYSKMFPGREKDVNALITSYILHQRNTDLDVSEKLRLLGSLLKRKPDLFFKRSRIKRILQLLFNNNLFENK